MSVDVVSLTLTADGPVVHGLSSKSGPKKEQTAFSSFFFVLNF